MLSHLALSWHLPPALDVYKRQIDVRTYPVRSISEPDTERITRGARDGFVETLLFNTNLIRRRVRSPKLTFSICSPVSYTHLVFPSPG